MAATTAAARTGTFAGYAGDEASSESDTAQAPFFVSGDVAEHVGGERVGFARHLRPREATEVGTSLLDT